MRAISEERGGVTLGEDGAETTVVIDPIDGSLNARRTLPSHCLSIAVAGGNSMDDVHFGYVYEFGAVRNPGGRNRDRIRSVGRNIVESALTKTHHLAVQDVHSRDDLHSEDTSRQRFSVARTVASRGRHSEPGE